MFLNDVCIETFVETLKNDSNPMHIYIYNIRLSRIYLRYVIGWIVLPKTPYNHTGSRVH